MKFVQVVHILFYITVVWKHKISTMNNNSIFRDYTVPVLYQSIVHLTPGLEWSVTILADMEMTEVAIRG